MDTTYCTFCTAEATHLVLDVDGDKSPLCTTCADVFKYARACISPTVISVEEDIDENEETDDEKA